jgi:hypothetical protein
MWTAPTSIPGVGEVISRGGVVAPDVTDALGDGELELAFGDGDTDGDADAEGEGEAEGDGDGEGLADGTSGSV